MERSPIHQKVNTSPPHMANTLFARPGTWVFELVCRDMGYYTSRGLYAPARPRRTFISSISPLPFISSISPSDR